MREKKKKKKITGTTVQPNFKSIFAKLQLRCDARGTAVLNCRHCNLPLNAKKCSVEHSLPVGLRSPPHRERHRVTQMAFSR